MARVALEIPKVGLVMENARLVRWLKNPGDSIAEGEPVLELETEKSVVEIEATVAGRLVEQLVQVDEETTVGAQVAWLETDASAGEPSARKEEKPEAAHDGTIDGRAPRAEASVSAPTEAHGEASASARTKARGGASASAPTETARGEASASAHTETARSGTGPGFGGRVRSSPVARRLASQSGIDISTISGTGPNGRVQLLDVRRALAARSSQTAGGKAEAQPLSNMRRALARAMTLSNATIPQFVVQRAVDWTSVQSARARLSVQIPAGEPKLSVNDFLLQGIAKALLSYPALNAIFNAGSDSSDGVISSDAAIVPANGAHIGLVVAVDNGLLVPVLHGVEKLSLRELAQRRADLVERALKGKLKQSELEGATFSLSNLGARGPDRFTAIINPPQSAILAVGRQRDCIVAINNATAIRPMSDLSLTVDHRVADGRLASEFLAYLVEILEGDIT